MTTTTPTTTFALYHRATGMRSKRWRLVSVHPTQAEARRAALAIDGSGDVWVSGVESTPAADTEVTDKRHMSFKTAPHQLRATT